MIALLNWTAQDTVNLRAAVAKADAKGQHFVLLKGKTVTTEYARHRLDCLADGQTDKVVPPSAPAELAVHA